MSKNYVRMFRNLRPAERSTLILNFLINHPTTFTECRVADAMRYTYLENPDLRPYFDFCESKPNQIKSGSYYESDSCPKSGSFPYSED